MVYLYVKKIPNYGENTHVFFNSYTDYNNWLGKAYLSFTEDRYTINENIIEVALPLPSQYAFDDVTYIAWNNNGVWRYYFVTSSMFQSGYAIYRIEVDLWATYISRASITDIRITRCNRNIGNGVYDNIPATIDKELTQLGGDLSTNDLAIVYVVTFATGVSSILINNAATSIGVYSQEMKDLPNEVTATGISTFDWYVNVISSIYGAEATIGNLDANVIKAYIIPKQYLLLKSSPFLPGFAVNSPLFKGNIVPSFEVAPYIFTKRYTIDINPNKKYYVGTKSAGLEITRTTQPTEILYNFIVKQDGLQVIVQQGDKMLDITDAFQVGLTSNDGNFTTSQQIAKTLQSIGGIASGAFQIASGGAGLVTGAVTATNAIMGVIEQGNARYTQGGDGISTYRTLRGEGTSPFYIQTNTSITDEAANARLNGATFNQQVASVDDIFGAALLGTGTLTDTYFAAEVRVDGIPTDARDVIATAIRGGIYAVKL